MKSVTLIALNAKYCHTSLAVRSIGAACRQQGICTNILECSVNEPFHQLMRMILEQESDVYAFSCYLWNIELVQKICVDLKKMKPNCCILLGGPEVSFTPLEYSFGDVVVCGEGEVSVPEFLLEKVPGPVIQGKTVEPLDKLPVCYTQEDLQENQHRLIYYESSRGCPYSCSYCLSSVDQGVRFMSVDRVCADLKRFDQAGVDLVKFVDRTFNADRKRSMAIWKFAAEQCPHTKFHFELAGDLLTEEELSYLATVPKGKFQFEIGIQSTNPRTLQAVDRNDSVTLLFDCTQKLLLPGNIHVHTDLIVGMPFETYEIFECSFNEVYALQSDCLQVGFLKLLKGSKIRTEETMWKYRYSNTAPYEIYDNAFLSYKEVVRLKMIAQTVERFYNSHAFDRSIASLVSKYPSPFECYEALSKQFDHAGAIAQKKLYEILFQFHREQFGEDKLFTEQLKFDWLFQTKGTPIPNWLGKHENLQPLLFRLLDKPQFKETYLPEYAHLKHKDLVKEMFLARFDFSDEVYYLFHGDVCLDVTKECFEIS